MPFLEEHYFDWFTFCWLTICRNILQVNLAINDAKDDWQREYLMEMSINTTSAEASQGLLREVSTEVRNDKQRESILWKCPSIQQVLRLLKVY